MRLLPDQARVLFFLAERSSEEHCYPFDPIARDTGVGRKRVRFICRHFRRLGLVEFHFPLWSDDGQPAGAGYCISKAGKKLALEYGVAS